MPPLNQLDNYDQCLVYDDRFAAYCFVDVTIKPQPDSELWNFIEVKCGVSVCKDSNRTFTFRAFLPTKNGIFVTIGCSAAFV
jgi:hypothetical protein